MRQFLSHELAVEEMPDTWKTLWAAKRRMKGQEGVSLLGQKEGKAFFFFFSEQVVPSCDIEEDTEGTEPFLTTPGN